MDFQIIRKTFIEFLERCRCGKMVKDLILKADKDSLYAMFTDSNSNMYAEIYDKSARIKEQGLVKIPSIAKIIDILKRSDSDSVLLKSVEGLFVITDGQKAGKFKVKVTEVGDEDFVESYHKVKQNPGLFDKKTLTYAKGKVTYADGFKIPIDSLVSVLADAKAFDFELFSFSIDKAGVLSCDIEDKSTNDTFTRKMITHEKIGNDIKAHAVGTGLREIIAGIVGGIGDSKDEAKKIVTVYFHERAILFTDLQTYYYNLNTI